MNAIVKSEAVIQFSDLEIPDISKWNNLGLFGQQSLDNVFGNFISGGLCYVGLACGSATSSTGAPLVTIGAGLFFRSGPGYALRDTATLNLSRYVAQVPDASKTLSVLIVVDGSEADLDGDETFLDQNRQPADPTVSWPTVDLATSLMKVRSVVPSPVGGTADVQPQDGNFDTTRLLPIARVIVGNTGILSVAQITGRQIATLDQLGQLVAAQGVLIANYQTTIAGLLSSVSSLAMALAQLKASDAAQFTALQQALAALESRQIVASNPTTILNITDTYTDTTSLTVQPNNPGYSVGSGLAFPQAVANPVPFFPLQEYASNLKVLGNRYMTAPYTEVLGPGNYRYYVNSLGIQGAFNLNVNSAGPWSITPLLEGFGVSRSRYGAAYGAQDASQILATADPTALFGINPGDIAYNAAWRPWASFAPEISHQSGYWHDLSSRGNWAPRVAGNPTGATSALSVVMQSPTDDMLTWMRFYGSANAGGTLRMLVCEEFGGAPDPNNVLMDVTGAVVGSNWEFTFPYPLLRKAGKRLHFVLLSNNALLLACPNTQPADPSLLTLLSCGTTGGWVQDQYGNMPLIDYNKASFRQGTPVELNLLYLGGGIDSLDLLTPAIVPQGCDIDFGTIPSGSTAYQRFAPVTAAQPNLLAGRPSQVRLFVEMLTTGSTAPVIDLQASASGSPNTVTGRFGAALVAQSPVRTPSAPVTKVTRQVTLAGFNPAIHTYTEKLDTGAGYATKTPPTATGTPVVQADGTTLMTFSWTLTTGAVANFMLDYLGNTQDTTQQFRIPKSITTAAP